MSIWVVEERDADVVGDEWLPLEGWDHHTKSNALEAATGRREYWRQNRVRGIKVRIAEYVRKEQP